jgi:NADH:ubiquinone reductase (non-electrogenic)
MHPLAEQLMHELGPQDHWRSLKTNRYLQVTGTDGTIFALGDAATIEQEAALKAATDLFQQGDVNGDGVLSCDEVLGLMLKARHRFPQLAEFASRMNCGGDDTGALMANFMHEILRYRTAPSYDNVIATANYADDDEDEASASSSSSSSQGNTMGSTMTLEQFQAQLEELDKGLRSLPATAQVASQQGEYLARLFKQHPITVRTKEQGASGPGELPENAQPFKYRHMGSLAYIGADKAVFDSPYKDSRVGALKGWLMGWAWKGAETFMQISLKNMYLVSRDLIKTKIFGRDVSDV